MRSSCLLFGSSMSLRICAFYPFISMSAFPFFDRPPWCTTGQKKAIRGYKFLEAKLRLLPDRLNPHLVCNVLGQHTQQHLLLLGRLAREHDTRFHAPPEHSVLKRYRPNRIAHTYMNIAFSHFLSNFGNQFAFFGQE